jgi:putative methionine-R-sulfoxide reductase with GAF domain
MGVPILSVDLAVAAVVYLDSSIPGFFTAPVQQLVGNACGGIANYIAEAY